MIQMTFTNLATKLMLNGNNINANQPQGDGFPYLKFAWEVKIASEFWENGLDSAPPLVAKTCELPKWSTETQVVNVYNHKTIVQTRLNYEPIIMSFYDQANNVAESMIWEYVKGQFDSTDGSKASTFTPLTIQITQKNLMGPGAEDKIYTLTNAFITDVQHDTLDYSVSDVVLWTITVRYEDLSVATYFEGQTPTNTASGVPVAPKPTPPKIIVNNPPVTPPSNVPPDAWYNAGGGEVTKNKGPDPYAAVTGIPRGRLGLHKLPGNTTNTATSTPVTTTNNSSYVAPTPTYDALGNQTGYDSSTGTNQPAVEKTAPTRTASPGLLQPDTPGVNPAYTKAYNDYLTAHPPATDSVQSRLAAQNVASAVAKSQVLMYTPNNTVTDTGVTANSTATKTREPTGPAVINGSGVANVNDTRSNALSSQQNSREQAYKNGK